MLVAVRKHSDAIRRTDRLPFEAIRKLEVTPEQFSASVDGAKRPGYFHPHFHLIVSDEATASAFVRRWLAHFPAATSRAQNIRVLDRREGAARELFKYAAKLVTRLEGRHTAIPFHVQDVIYKAVKGLRTWQAMGIRALPVELPEEGGLVLDASTRAEKRSGDSITWDWCSAVNDWIDLTTGEALCGDLPPSLAQLVSNVRFDAQRLDVRMSETKWPSTMRQTSNAL